MYDIKNDNNIKYLIECEKYFKRPPTKPENINKNVSFKFNLYHNIKQEEIEFNIFCTKSQHMKQDFSIGLMYENYNLIRCNGFHGTTKANFFIAEHHAYPHAHILTYEDIKNERSRTPSSIINLQGEYIDFQTALLYFCVKCAIIGYEDYFDFNEQIAFF